MNFSFEQIEAQLGQMQPKSLTAAQGSDLLDELRAASGELPEWTPEHAAIEAKLASVLPHSLHPQQREVCRNARRDGQFEADLASVSPASPNSAWAGETVSLMEAGDITHIAPSALSEQTADRLAGLMAAAEAQGRDGAGDVAPEQTGKVLAFPGRGRQFGGRFLKAAAAVAIFGAVIGAFLPDQKAPENQLAFSGPTGAPNSQPGSAPSNQDPVMPAFASAFSHEWIPATVSSEARAARDAGVRLIDGRQTVRDVEFERVEKLLFVDEEGRLREYERPLGVEHLSVPVETN